MAVNSKDLTSKKLAFSITALLLIASLVVFATPARANPGPDVEPTALYIFPDSPVRAGDTVTLTYEWSNENGDQDAQTDVVLYDDDGTGPTEVDRLEDVMMAAGTNGLGELQWTAGDEGEHNLSVYFDVNDDDTGNNNLTMPYEVEPASGDAELFVNFEGMQPETQPQVEQNVHITLSFGNNGDITPQVNISVGIFAYMGEQGTDRPAEPVDEFQTDILWKGMEFPTWEGIWVPQEGGPHNVELIIDYQDNLSADAGATDSNTDNNIYFTEVDVEGGGAGIDLMFDEVDPNNAFTAEPDRGVTDSHVTFKYVVLNQGSMESDPGVRLALYVKTKNAGSWPGTPTNTSTPIPEPIRGNKTDPKVGPMVELGWDIPSDAEGYWDIKIVVDFEDNVEESDETNNEMIWSIIHKNEPGDDKYYEVVKELPNLQIASINLDTAYAGEPIDVTFEVINSLGQVMAKDVKIEVKLYSYQNATEWTEKTAALVGDVGTDAPTNYVWSWIPPEVGDFEIKGYVDPQNDIEELNDNPNDNKKSKPVTVKEKLPDLAVDNIEYGPTTDEGDLQVGLPSYITLTMVNDGLRELTQAEGDRINITFDLNYGEVIGQVNFGKPLAKGATALVTFYLSAENGTLIESQQRRNIAVEIDPANKVVEIEDDYNNLIETSVYFKSTIDAFIENIVLDMAQPQTKTPLEISFDIGVQNVPAYIDCNVSWMMDIVDSETLDSMDSPTGYFILNATNNLTTITYEWTPLLEGNYTVKLEIDYGQDNDPANDAVQHNFSVKEFHTDLQIAETGGIAIDTYQSGERTVTVLVGYIGDAASVKNVKVWVRVYDTTNWNGNWDTAILKRDLNNQTVDGSISKGDTRSLTYSWPGATKGCYVIVAFVDPDDDIHEDQEENNLFPSKNIAIDNGCFVAPTGDDDDDDDSPALGMFASLAASMIAVALVALRRRH